MDSLNRLASDVTALRQRLQEALQQVVVGLEKSTDLLLMALLAGGHVLLEGVPGTAKTTLCRSFATALGMHFERIQFTPDLLPSDVTGTQILDRKASDFVLRKGPVFCQVLLADELNRAPARTQSSLLEAMQEQQVTIEGQTLPLPAPFFVLATQNPIEQEGVYRLPEAQLDRFLFRVEIGYPQLQEEVTMLKLHMRSQASIQAVTNHEEIRRLKLQIEGVHVTDELQTYIVHLIRSSREHPDLLLGGSPRAAISLMKAARVQALIENRCYVTHADIQAVAIPVLGHRLILRPEAEMDERSPALVITELLSRLPVIEEGVLQVRKER